jgi:outer membrane scaffolding protein for murein synthesis (MipA/OmpV family)
MRYYYVGCALQQVSVGEGAGIKKEVNQIYKYERMFIPSVSQFFKKIYVEF